MNPSITDFTNACGQPNIQGLASFRFVPVDEVDGWPDYDEANNSPVTDIALLTGGAWRLGTSLFGSLKFSEGEDGNNANGPIYKPSLDGVVPGDSAALGALMVAMAARRYIIEYTDKNRAVRIVGTKESPCTFTAAFTTEGVRGYKFRFECNSGARALNYAL